MSQYVSVTEYGSDPPMMTQLAVIGVPAVTVFGRVIAALRGAGEPVIENSLLKELLAPVVSVTLMFKRPRVPNKGVKVTVFPMTSAEIYWPLASV